MKTLINFFKSIFFRVRHSILNWYFKKSKVLQKNSFADAVKAAQTLATNFNRTYYVSRINNEYMVFCKDDIRLMKKSGIWKNNITHLDIIRDCMFHTSMTNNDVVKAHEKKQRYIKFTKANIK